MTSILPPAANGTRTFTGRCGQACAVAGVTGQHAMAADGEQRAALRSGGVNTANLPVEGVRSNRTLARGVTRCQLAQSPHIVARRRVGPRGRGLLVAIDALAPLVALLRLDREGGDRPRFQPLERDRLAGLLAIAVGAVIEPGERRLDLGDQLALAVAGAQLDRAVGFGGGAVGQVGMILVFRLEVRQRLLRLLQDILAPG